MSRLVQPVRFDFGRCDLSVLIRSVVAAVDHLCADVDIPMELLDALEFPLAESLTALSANGIETVDVAIDNGRLSVKVGVRSPVDSDLPSALGDAADIIESFFAVSRTDAGDFVELVGELQ